MAPGTYNYSVEGGDCLPLIVVLKDGNAAAISLVGYTSTFTLTWPGGGITLTDNNERLEMGSDDSPDVDGQIEGMLQASETSLLPYGQVAQYEWSVMEPSGCKKTFLKGYIERT